MSEISERDFGRLEAEVQALQRELNTIQADVKCLLELANKSKGGFWFGMTFVSGISMIIGFVLSFWRGGH